MDGSKGEGGSLSWWRLGRSGWRTVLRRTATQFKEDQVATLSASVTLRFVLALVPSLIAAVAITAQFASPADLERLVASGQEFIPEQSRVFVVDTLERILLDESGGAASIIGVLAGLFAATSAAATLTKALDGAYDVEDERGFIGQRLVSLAIVVALLVTLVGMFVALVLGPSLVGLLLPEQVMDSPLRYLITIARYLTAIVLLIVFFGFTFRLAPNRDQTKLRPLTPGAVLGVTGWLLLSYLFSLYVRIAGNYAAYGAAAGVFILLVWLNYSFVVLLMGAELDHEIELHLSDTRASSQGATHGATPTGPDLDRVDPEMPRHPGLIAAERPRAGVSGRGREADGRASGSIQGPGRDPGVRVVVPPLMGAARHTAGARFAHRVWNRLGG